MHISTIRPPPLRIGGACAFRGDSNAAVAQLVRGGHVRMPVFDHPALGRTFAKVLLASPLCIPAAREGGIDKRPPLAAGTSEVRL